MGDGGGGVWCVCVRVVVGGLYTMWEGDRMLVYVRVCVAMDVRISHAFFHLRLPSSFVLVRAGIFDGDQSAEEMFGGLGAYGEMAEELD